MKRYSIAPSSARRKSTIGGGLGGSGTPAVGGTAMGDPAGNDRLSASLELERLEQETTIVLQEIDKNLSDSNAIINDKIFPVIRKYSKSSESVWQNVGFWKHFFELAANTEIASYESPKVSNDLNTMANTQKNLLLLDDEDDERSHQLYNENDNVDAHGGEAQAAKKSDSQIDNQGESAHNLHLIKFGDTASKDLYFKKPLLRDNIEELTPTWSTEQPHKRMAGSIHMPHLESRVPAKRFNKYDSTDSLSINPPPMTSTNINQQHDVPSQGQTNRSPTRTYTIRQSLDNYHKLSISPRKTSRYLKTPVRGDDDMRKRSSMIQDLINSSPTLPEPPILASEIESYNPKSNSESTSNPHSNVNYDPPSELRDFERLSPINLDENRPDSDNPQRFPRTPQFERMGLGSRRHLRRSSNRIKTPIEIRNEVHEDDSDLKPPTMSEKRPGPEPVDADEEEEDVPFPDLETIDLKRKVDEFNRKKRKLDEASQDDAHGLPKKDQQEKQQSTNEKDNVFLDDKSGNHSITSTIYHSIMNQHHRNPSNSNSNSKESTSNQSKSISNLFEDVLLDLQNKPSQPPAPAAQDHEPYEPQVGTAGSSNTGRSNESTKDMGSMLEERFKRFIGK